MSIPRDKDYPLPPRWQRLYDQSFPQHTDPYSRHVKTISQAMRDLRSPLRTVLGEAGYEPDHMASSMEETVKMLWKAREELESLRSALLKAKGEAK